MTAGIEPTTNPGKGKTIGQWRRFHRSHNSPDPSFIRGGSIRNILIPVDPAYDRYILYEIAEVVEGGYAISADHPMPWVSAIYYVVVGLQTVAALDGEATGRVRTRTRNAAKLVATKDSRGESLNSEIEEDWDDALSSLDNALTRLETLTLYGIAGGKELKDIGELFRDFMGLLIHDHDDMVIDVNMAREITLQIRNHVRMGWAGIDQLSQPILGDGGDNNDPDLEPA